MAEEERKTGTAADKRETKVYLERLDDMDQFLQAVGTMVDLLMNVGPRGIKAVSGVMRKIAV